MYIRWIIRKHRNEAVADVTFHDAYLVESFRDAANMPRQRTICYLGNIRQIGDTFPTIERELFFLRAERILASQPELNGDEREQTLALLRQKIPPLTDAEVLIAFRNNLRWYRNWWRERGVALRREDLLAMLDEEDQRLDPI